MNYTWLILINCLLGLSQLEAELVGGRERMTDEDFNSEDFKKVLQEANKECNNKSNSRYWHNYEAILDATKQVVSGMKYVFKLRQRPTNCNNSLVNESESKQPQSTCVIQLGKNVQICSVDVWHQPWLPDPMGVKVGALWTVVPDHPTSSELYRPVDDDLIQSEWFLKKLNKAVDKFNLESNQTKLYSYGSVSGNYEQNFVDEQTSVTVELMETNCDSTKELATLMKMKTEECFELPTGHLLSCSYRIGKQTMLQEKLRNCQPEKRVTRGMWRSSGPRLGSQGACYPEELMKPAENGDQKPFKVEKMNNFARSSIQTLTRDELNSKEFQDLIKLAAWQYNLRSNALNMYKLDKVKNVKVELVPKKSYTFNLIMKETKCRKNEGFMEIEKFNKDCKEMNDKGLTQNCQATADVADPGTGIKEKFTFSKCEGTKTIPGFLVGAVQDADTDAIRQQLAALANNAVKEYNKRSNSVFEFELEKYENGAHQTVAGKLYTMNVTMKAKSCKNEAEPSCSQTDVDNFIHCHVTVLQQPWNMVENFTFTHCWNSTQLTVTLKGKWKELTMDALRIPELEKLKEKAVEKYNTITETEYVLDFVRSFMRMEAIKGRMYNFQLHIKQKQNSTEKRQCTVLILEPTLRTSETQYVVYNCHKKAIPNVPRLVGAPSKFSEEALMDKDFQTKVLGAVKTYNDQINDLYFHRLIRVVNATTQVVSGMKTVITLQLQQTSCTKNEHSKHIENQKYHLCGKLNQTHTTICKASIWERPWEKFEQTKFMDCSIEPATISVHSISDDQQATSEFDAMLSRTINVFNVGSDQKVLYKNHLVENISKMDTKEIEFDLLLKPTKCKKWEETSLFLTKQDAICTGVAPSNVIHCKVNVKEAENSEDDEKISLSSCRSMYKGKFSSLKPWNWSEKSISKLHEIVDRAVTLFNSKVSSLFWHKLFKIDTPVIEHVAGEQLKFNLHMVPSNCRPEGNQNTTNNQSNCKESQPKYMVTCKVSYWKRAWRRDHETLDVHGCEIVPIIPWLSTNKIPDRLRDYKKKCIRILLLRFENLFNQRKTLSHVYREFAVENIEEQHTAGKSYTFDLFLKPTLKSLNCTNVGEENEKCRFQKHFYTCKASVWLRTWQQSEQLDLSQCTRINEKRVEKVGALNQISDFEQKETLDPIQKKAVKLYNEQLADFYIFGMESIEDVQQQLVAGSKTTFNLRMKPIGCKRTKGRRNCEPENSVTRVQCTVTMWERPWLSQSEQLLLENCNEFFNESPGLQGQPLLEEVLNSDQFKETAKRMGALYSPRVPILYEVEKISNAIVKMDEKGRNTSYDLLLKPVGCDTSKPNSNEKACVNWNKQDKVECKALVVQQPSPNGPKTLFLDKCRELWDAESQRQLSADEYNSVWFLESQLGAWKLAHKIKPSENLYRVFAVKDGTIERKEDELVKYKMLLKKTVCQKNKDEDKFKNGASNECEASSPQETLLCSVERRTKPTGEYNQKINCQIK